MKLLALLLMMTAAAVAQEGTEVSGSEMKEREEGEWREMSRRQRERDEEIDKWRTISSSLWLKLRPPVSLDNVESGK